MFHYDALNRMIVKIVPGCSDLTPAQTRDVHYEYDLRGLQTKARFDSLAGEGVTTAYDGFGRVSSSTLLMAGVSRSIGHLYDADGNRIRITHPDGHFFTYEYDGLNRFRLAREDGAAALVSFAYDPAGRRSGLTSGGIASGYGYDGVGRLNSLTHNLAGTSGDQTIGLSYNPASQIVTRTGSNDGYAWTGSVAVSRDYQTNGQNQYTGTISNGTPSAAFGYDPNGNLTSDGSSNFLYDIENRLVSASGAKSATLVYDPLGRLWEVTSPAAGTTRFLYDDDALIGEYDSAGTMNRRYIHGAEKSTDDPLIWYEYPVNGYRRALVADQQGSIIAAADMFGNPVVTNAYDEYGIPKTGNAGRFQYTGQAWLAELGMYYYKARIYSPTLGRFMQVDPIGYDGGINLYAYVSDDPINKQDPSGLDPQEAAQWAYKMIDNRNYQESDPDSRVGGLKATKPIFGSGGVGAPKCNFFVYDALRAGGVAPGVVNGRDEIPTASRHWSNRSSRIQNYRPLRSGERPQLGDVVSNKGHVGIVVGTPHPRPGGPEMQGYITASAADSNHGDRVTITGFGFRQKDNPRSVVIWRYSPPTQRGK